MMNTLPSLRKQLYNAARLHIDPVHRDDPSAVRALRDRVCWDRYSRGYDELTSTELKVLIRMLNNAVPSEYAGDKLVKTLRFYAMACGLVYASFDGIAFEDPDTGNIYEGTDARDAVTLIFEQYLRESKFAVIPQPVYRHIYTDWINPKCHEFLIQGGYRKYAKNPAAFYFEKLTPTEANYLIKRFKLIHSQIKMKSVIPTDLRSN